MYNYKTQKPNIFTEEGVTLFISIRDNCKRLLEEAGAARMQEIVSGQTGDTWDFLACVDRLIELGEIKEITGTSASGKHRIFTYAK